MSRYSDDGCAGVIMLLIIWFVVATSWWDRWHSTRTAHSLDPMILWFLTILFVIVPAVMLCYGLFYEGFRRLLRPGGGRHSSQEPSQPSPEELERQKHEAERLRQLEETKARAEWEQYHRRRRIDEIDEMTWHQFEEFAIILFRKVGFLNVRGTSINDQGADLLCDAQADGRSKKVVVQAKHWRARVGNGAVQEVIAAMVYYTADLAFVLTASDYTSSARELAARDPRITLIDRAELVRWIERYWPQEIPEFNRDQYTKNVKSRYPARQGARRTFRQSPFRTMGQTNRSTPTCPKCGAPLRLITPRPSDTWKAFWGCTLHNVTGCKGTVNQ